MKDFVGHKNVKSFFLSIVSWAAVFQTLALDPLEKLRDLDLTNMSLVKAQNSNADVLRGPIFPSRNLQF